MSWIRSRYTALVVASLGLAAMLGGSLGMVVAAPRSVSVYEGQNLIGGPLQSMPPKTFTSCLPGDKWDALYIWDSRKADEGGQKWLHYVNGVPEVVNSPQVNGIENLPVGAGIVLIATDDFTGLFKTRASDTC